MYYIMQIMTDGGGSSYNVCSQWGRTLLPGQWQLCRPFGLDEAVASFEKTCVLACRCASDGLADASHSARSLFGAQPLRQAASHSHSIHPSIYPSIHP